MDPAFCEGVCVYKQVHSEVQSEVSALFFAPRPYGPSAAAGDA